MIGISARNAATSASARTARLLAVVALLGARDLRAQDSTAAPRGSWMIAGSIGMLGSGTQLAPAELMTIGVHFTQVRPGRLGADISVGTIPRALADGIVAVGARLGVALPLAVTPGVLLLPSAGFSLIGAAGGGGAGGTAGYNVGGAAVFGTGPVGFRTGITWHHMNFSNSALWLLEVGVAGRP
jgi:hypothetical protein